MPRTGPRPSSSSPTWRLSAPRTTRRLLHTDRRIHRFAYRCAKNPFLAETLDHYHNLSLRILHVAMRRYPALTPRLDDVVHDQRLLLEAIGRGDGDAAERVAATHISTFERAIRELI